MCDRLVIDRPANAGRLKTPTALAGLVNNSPLLSNGHFRGQHLFSRCKYGSAIMFHSLGYYWFACLALLVVSSAFADFTSSDSAVLSSINQHTGNTAYNLDLIYSDVNYIKQCFYQDFDGIVESLSTISDNSDDILSKVSTINTKLTTIRDNLTSIKTYTGNLDDNFETFLVDFAEPYFPMIHTNMMYLSGIYNSLTNLDFSLSVSNLAINVTNIDYRAYFATNNHWLSEIAFSSGVTTQLLDQIRGYTETNAHILMQAARISDETSIDGFSPAIAIAVTNTFESMMLSKIYQVLTNLNISGGQFYTNNVISTDMSLFHNPSLSGTFPSGDLDSLYTYMNGYYYQLAQGNWKTAGTYWKNAYKRYGSWKWDALKTLFVLSPDPDSIVGSGIWRPDRFVKTIEAYMFPDSQSAGTEAQFFRTYRDTYYNQYGVLPLRRDFESVMPVYSNLNNLAQLVVSNMNYSGITWTPDNLLSSDGSVKEEFTNKVTSIFSNLARSFLPSGIYSAEGPVTNDIVAIDDENLDSLKRDIQTDSKYSRIESFTSTINSSSSSVVNNLTSHGEEPGYWRIELPVWSFMGHSIMLGSIDVIGQPSKLHSIVTFVVYAFKVVMFFSFMAYCIYTLSNWHQSSDPF